MMVTCPKCSFVQPKDRYCANCGVDMESYNPAPPPIHTRLFRNSTFLLSVVVVLILGMIFYIYSHQQKRLSQQVVEFSEVEENLDDDQTEAVPQAEERALSRRESVETATDPSQRMPQNPSGENLGNSPSPKTAEGQMEVQTAKAKSPVKPPSTFIVRFFEVDQNTLNQIFSESQILSETENIKSASLPFKANLDQLKTKYNRIKDLPGLSSSALTANQALTIDYTTQDNTNSPDPPPGLNLRLNPTQISADKVDFEIQGSLNLASTNTEEFASLNIDGAYTMPANTVILIAGIVPHREATDEEISLFSGTPLSVLGSPEFIKAETEFLVVIQAK